MKIFTLNNLAKVTCAGFAAGYMYFAYNIYKDTGNYKSVDDLKKEIKLKDPNRYNAIMQKPPLTRPVTYQDWNYEVEIMNDSLKNAGLIERARFEGEQKVKDSIANAERAK